VGWVGSASAPGQCPTALALLRPKRWKSAAQLPAGLELDLLAGVDREEGAHPSENELTL